MKHLTLTNLLCLCATLLLAQTEDGYYHGSTERAFLDMVPEFELAYPVGEFAADINRDVLVGKGIGMYYRFARQPVDVGVRFTGFTYDKMRRRYRDTIDNFPAVQKTKHKIWLLQGVVRFEPPLNTSTILFMEGAAGWRRFYSKSFSRERNLIDLTTDENTQLLERFDRVTHNSDWGAAISTSVGAKFILEQTWKTALEVKLCYHWGVSGDFMIRNDLEEIQDDPFENLEEQHAPLTMFSLKIGISFLGYNGS